MPALDSATSSKSRKFNIGMVLNGSCFQTIMKNLPAIQSSGLRLVAVADVQKSVLRHKDAEESGIKVFDDYLDLLTMRAWT